MTDVLEHDVKYKMQDNMLVTYHKDQNKESQYWRVEKPDNDELRTLMIAELHEIQFMDHSTVSTTVIESELFLLEGHGRRNRAFVEAFQLEKSDHSLSK